MKHESECDMTGIIKAIVQNVYARIRDSTTVGNGGGITAKDIDSIKRNVLRHSKCKRTPSNSDILKYIQTSHIAKYVQIRKYFVKKPMRTGSGVTPVAVMIKPEGSCKHNCIYCPYTGKAAKSYTGEEPAALRARANNFDPYLQVVSRLRQYSETGHDTTKIELIVMGGTFLEMNEKYKTHFVKSLFDALNGKISKSLSDAIGMNEHATHRCVGLTIETRPDVCSRKDINRMLDFGTTRVELGVQHPDDKIYSIVKRGHTVSDVVEATRNLRDAGLKVLYHIMLGLPGSDPNKDVNMVRDLFSDPRFKPDMIKIYPTLLMRNTELYEWYKQGRYIPYNSELAAETIAEAYRYIPKYVRVMRIQRDIPATLIENGVKKSNLRQIVDKKVTEKGIKQIGIREREIGKRGGSLDSLGSEGVGNNIPNVTVKKYDTLGGDEYFISFENEDVLVGFVRLRIPEESWKCEEMNIHRCGFVRELHVYGNETPLGLVGESQHRGVGSKLLETAERIAGENGVKRVLIQSGVGVREYYRKRGYSLFGTYMLKEIA